ncbi:hypothetical protein [Rhizobium phaseoli]|uniref:Uncharacterized protein n=1 Tax=Rhizobium phaseoli TaxID=396 RepID=A0ABM6CLI8_9HYPH|nr:hypothetical protein [Rhizobium phaseoli]KEC69697.1 hypothetical protein RLPCCGM1_p1729 [Rhizobium leguminosarum bv. phaseoli CCGM1]ANL57320.1 hypothetical protein AMC86_PD00861 [Rhizobium phaseoli]ANL89218.1 hypothetical protein AMC81_PE00975 [Rhizobium phaseoli]ANL95727.1 hypothetical protein AMC80_PE00975 [Rhizobium phaseoli]PWI51000.1 hypothetical protein B5K03_27325 [Rhizobium phaseoli]
MHNDPELCRLEIQKVADILRNGSQLDAYGIEHLMIFGAVHLRKMDEHKYLKPSHGLKGRAFAGTNVLDFCDRIMHSKYMHTQDANHIEVQSDKWNRPPIVTTLVDMTALFVEYAENSLVKVP